MDSNDPTLGEIARRLNEVFAKFDQVTSDLPRTFVNKDLFDAYKELAKANHERLQAELEAAKASHEKRIADLEDDKTWLYRLVIGAVILAVLAMVIGTAHTLTSNSGSTKSSTHSMRSVSVQ